MIDTIFLDDEFEWIDFLHRPAKKSAVVTKGGPGSGNHGHVGRPGKVGGSASGGATAAYKPGNGDDYIPDEYGETVRVFDAIHSKTILDIGADEYRITSSIKNNTVTNLARDARVSYGVANHFIKQWAQTSNDNSPDSLSFQQAASEEFEVPLSKWQQEKIENYNDGVYLAESAIGEPRKILTLDGDEIHTATLTRRDERDMLRSMYERTQKALEEQGVGSDDYIILYRGIQLDNMPFEEGDIVKYHGNAIEAWSTSKATAGEFAFGGMDFTPGALLRMRVPRRNILSMPHTGFGCLEEDEVVIFGSIPGNHVYIENLAREDMQE